MYSDKLWSDCTEAKSFFAYHAINVIYKDIAVTGIREELKKRYGVSIVPTIIIGNEKLIGFENNLEKIKRLFKIS